MGVTGSLLNSYLICPRQAWLGGHAISGDCDNDYLRQGTFIHQKSYERKQKEKNFGNSMLDTVEKKNGIVVIGETKKSSSCLESACMQLAFYLYQLKEDGIEAIGNLQVPEEKLSIEVILDDETETNLLRQMELLEKLLKEELPPKAIWHRYCEKCSYRESCFA